MLCFIAVLVIEYKGSRKRARECRELEHFAEFLSNLKNQFFLCKNITESIFRAAEQVPGSLRKRLEEICFLLEEDAGGIDLMEENFPEHLKYVRLFGIQCQNAIRYGSGKNSAESVFVKNMTELRRDVQNECYQRTQAKYLFGGIGVVAVLPVVFLPFIKWFGKITMEELQEFYESRTGAMVVAVFCILTVCCYAALCMIRQTDKRVYQRPRFVRRFFSNSSVHWIAECCKGSKMEKIGARYLEKVGIEANGMQFWALGWSLATVLGVTFFVLLRGVSIEVQLVVTGLGVMTGIVLCAGFYSYIGYLRKLGIDGEVLNLQAMILLMLDVPNMTLTGLLDALGCYGELYRNKLLRCADTYAAEDVKALEQLFAEEESPVFRQLAGRILASERVGMKVAFSEIASDRHFFREQLKFDMEQERKKKAANAQVVAFLPMMFLLFAYLILPFLVVSLEQMGQIFREMEQIRYFN